MQHLELPGPGGVEGWRGGGVEGLRSGAYVTNYLTTSNAQGYHTLSDLLAQPSYAVALHSLQHNAYSEC